MRRLKCPRPKSWKPSMSIIVALLIVAGAVAFAFLQSQARLNGNSIETDSASLLISQNDITYSNSAAGYRFSHIIPGSQPSQTEHFFLKNIGGVPLELAASAPEAPNNPDSIDLDKVRIILTPHDPTTYAPEASQSFSLRSLLDAGPGGAPINASAALGSNMTEEFDIQAAMDADAVTGSGAALSNLDLVFTGVGTND